VEAPCTRLRLRVAPGAGRAGIAGRLGEAWKIRVTAPAEGGRANEAVLRLLAETLQLPRRDVTLVSGQSSREKIVQLAGVGALEAERRLTSAQERKDGRR
jgi:uncharacterized protein (TIGR00251 family)